MTALAAISGQPRSVPAHFDAEVLRGLRRVARRGFLTRPRLDATVRLLAQFSAERVPLRALLLRAHALGDRFSAGDAFYIALARAYDAELVSCDRRLARGADGIARVRLV